MSGLPYLTQSPSTNTLASTLSCLEIRVRWQEKRKDQGGDNEINILPKRVVERASALSALVHSHRERHHSKMWVQITLEILSCLDRFIQTDVPLSNYFRGAKSEREGRTDLKRTCRLRLDDSIESGSATMI